MKKFTLRNCSTFVEHPVPHIRINNFFPKDMFDDIVATTEQGGSKGHQFLSQLSYPPDTELSTRVKEETVQYFVETILPHYSAIAKQLGMDALDPRDIVYRSTLQACNTADYEIHQDTVRKHLTALIYVSPQVNTGTLFYENKEGDGRYEDTWEPNCGYIFMRSKDSWHNYENTDPDNLRWVWMFNAMSNVKP